MTPVAGIDYSMNCPAICVFKGGEFKPENCVMYFLTTKKKYVDDFGHNIEGDEIDPSSTDEQRYDQIAQFFANVCKVFGVKQVAIEGYSMGSKGKVFNIAENTGVLKNKLYNLGCEITLAPPKTVKKFATDNGNAKKGDMGEAFKEETGIDLKEEMIPDLKEFDSPAGDVVDAYYICKWYCEEVLNYESSTGQING